MSNPSTGSREWLSDLLIRKCNIFSPPSAYQLDHGLDPIVVKKVFLVIAPATGKITLLRAPLLAAQAHGGLTLGVLNSRRSLAARSLAACPKRASRISGTKPLARRQY
ncbi:hypothetical protein B0H21DRAFT_709742 [Amylocystis lapponica]|nr:hypothetical protein B0H21DRAFT_709742 [Amylocystis lapponica]